MTREGAPRLARPRRPLATAGAVLLLAALVAVLSAKTVSAVSIIIVPPVTITGLYHYSHGDGVDFDSGSGAALRGAYTSDGFTATIRRNDIVRVRLQAPAGKKFVVHYLGAGEELQFNTQWFAGGAENTITGPYTVTFEGLSGPAPVETYSYNGVGSNASWIGSLMRFAVQGAFEFTALQIDLAVSHAVPGVQRVYPAVNTGSVPGFSTGLSSPTTATVMEIVDLGATPTRTTTWGRIKTLYR